MLWNAERTKTTRLFDSKSDACRFTHSLAQRGLFPSLIGVSYSSWSATMPPGTRVGFAVVISMPQHGKVDLRCDCGDAFQLHPSMVALRIARGPSSRGRYCTKSCGLRGIAKNLIAARQNAKKIGVGCTLTHLDVFELRATGVCSYRHCGRPLPVRGSGLDRKDSRAGYTRENCVACCTQCNTVKGGFLSHDDWQAVLDARAARGADMNFLSR